MYKAFKSNFINAIFAGLVLNDLFADVGVAGPFGQDWNIAVHFTVHFNAFYHIEAICFQAAIKIVQMNPA